MFEIRDWANNLCFMSDRMGLQSFDEAEETLSILLGNNYDEERQEYEIVEVA